MQEGTVLNLHLARVKGTPSEPVATATAISARGLEGDRSCRVGNARQVLVMDKETLDHFQLAPGQIKENITTAGLDLAQAQPGAGVFRGGRGLRWKWWGSVNRAARWMPFGWGCGRSCGTGGAF